MMNMKIVEMPKKEQGIITLSEKEQKKFEKDKKKEERKRRWTLLKARLLKGKLSPEDTRTIQVHKDVQGNFRNYYISNKYLQDSSAYTAVNSILEDYENHRFVYRGFIQGADNAIGVLEANVPLSEIVASPNGNVLLQKILLEENATRVCNQYYEAIGEKLEPLKDHTTYFGKPDFVLGTILADKKGQYTYSESIGPDIEERLQQEREQDKREESMRDKASVVMDLGQGMVVSEQDCWLEQGNGIQFAGVNKDALYYQYVPKQPIQTEDNKYVYVGKVQIGQPTKMNQQAGEPIQFVRPDTYENVVLWTEGENLVQYFLNKKFAGLNFVLGKNFTNYDIKNAEKGSKQEAYLGGLTIDENGECKMVQNIPESVKKAVEEYLEQKGNEQGRDTNIIDFKAKKDDGR